MIIDGTNNSVLINKFDNQKTGSAASKGSLVIKGEEKETGDANASDKVNISERSRLIAKATELATLAPDVRSEKVADLTAKIAAGNYKVNADEVATAIIKKGLTGVMV
ncbi:MAG: flagellar biosynthesis anti-sigma factor FlgM [Deltaproteobacteria bacterium]|jgi:negative regulator of flagellin synthesis FlgM|nr:flagellar biosynthesis anti-sigma factor FlgM [Deltaproteobacteria bacterium]